MLLGTKDDKELGAIIEQLALGDEDTLDRVDSLLMWGLYGHRVLSQFGLGLCGYVFRQSRTNVLMTVKVEESGVPLVGFITSATTIGCIEQMFDLLAGGRLKWQKDKYPWI